MNEELQAYLLAEITKLREEQQAQREQDIRDEAEKWAERERHWARYDALEERIAALEAVEVVVEEVEGEAEPEPEPETKTTPESTTLEPSPEKKAEKKAHKSFFW